MGGGAQRHPTEASDEGSDEAADEASDDESSTSVSVGSELLQGSTVGLPIQCIMPFHVLRRRGIF